MFIYKYEDFILELFNLPMSLIWKDTPSENKNEERYECTFVVNKLKYKIAFSLTNKKYKIWQATYFLIKGNELITTIDRGGNQNAKKVLATVIKAIHDFKKNINPNIIEFVVEKTTGISDIKDRIYSYILDSNNLTYDKQETDKYISYFIYEENYKKLIPKLKRGKKLL